MAGEMEVEMEMEIEMENLPQVTIAETEPIAVKKHRISSIMPIVMFSYVGVLIRLNLNLLGTNHTPLVEAFWPNFVGCFIMGFIVEQKIHIQQHYPQFYIGLTTGLCGSITTFSGLMYNSCLALFGRSNEIVYPVSNYLAVMISALAASFVGFRAGRHLGLCVFPLLTSILPKVNCLNDRARLWIFPILFLITIPSQIVPVVLLPVGHYTYFIYSTIFAPLGSLTRYGLSIAFNINSDFPVGTLLANVIGSFIYFGIVAIQQYVHIRSPLVQHILTSLIQGYCGCLTTVSTFILELDTIKRRRYLYAYFLMTILPVQIVYILIGDIFNLLCSPVS